MYLHDLVFSGVNPQVELQPPLYLEWSFQTRGSLSASPIVVGETVYLASTDQHLYALPAESWGERWRFAAQAPLDLTPVYANGILVCVDRRANLYGLNAETGEPIWKTQLPGWTSAPPVFAGGFIWVGVHPDRIVGLDPRTGHKMTEASRQTTLGGVLYVSRRGSLAPAQPATAPVPPGDGLPYAEASPVRAGGYTYVAYTDGSVRAFDGSGAPVWSERLPAPIRAAPAIAKGRLYLAATDGALYVFKSGAPPPAPSELDRPRATVVPWEASLRPEPGSEERIALLNQQTQVPVMEEKDGWARVRLPDGREGWLAPGDWAVLQEPEEGWPFRVDRRLVEAVQTLQLPRGAEYPRWAPDGRQVAFYRRLQLGGRYWSAQELWTLDTRNGEGKRLAQGSFYNPWLSWSLDGVWLGLEVLEDSEFTVQLISVATSERLLISLGMSPSWSPTAHHLAYYRATEEGEELWRINSNGTEPFRIAKLPLLGYLGGEYRPHLPAAWHPRAQYLAVGADARFYPDHAARLLIVPVAPEATPKPTQTPAERFHWLEWSPDGTKVGAILSGHVGGSVSDPLDRRVYIYWLDQSQPPRSLPRAVAAAWVDAERLAYLDRSPNDPEVFRLWVWNVLHDRRRLAALVTAPVSGIQWLQDRRLLSIWTTTPYYREGRLQAAETTGWLFRLSPDGEPF
ncbi:MAG: hypothetical protein KatS3mg115_0804 [Candidatus Poribacteria bacterium]|nr:MAG: hypothetical protein KatS3mg115_0804 [Candidatus Poribacteria bacterium]